MIENVHLYRECKLVDTASDFEKQVAHSRFEDTTIISENLVVIHKRPRKLLLNKNYCAGFSVLELSKFLMYDMLYNKILPIVPDFRVIYTDTDSFLAETNHHPEDFFELIRSICDFSKYPPSHKLYSSKNKNRLNFLKDEMEGKHYISEFIGLRAKCYALKLKPFDEQNNVKVEKLRCKGIQKNVVKNEMQFEEYFSSLFENNIIRKNNISIKRKKFKLFTTVQKKIALSPFDSKRYICNCGIHTYSMGHYLCKEILQKNGECPQC